MEQQKTLFIISHPFLPPTENGVTRRFLSLKKYLPSDKFDVLLINNALLDKKTFSAHHTYDQSPLQKLKKAYFKLPIEKYLPRFFFKNLHYLLKSISGFFWLLRNKKITKSLIEESIRNKRKVILFTSYSPLESSLLGLRLKKTFKENIIWISDHRDEMSHNSYIPSIARLHNKFYEKKILEKADLCSVVSEGQKTHYASLYSKLSQKCAVFMNGYDFVPTDRTDPPKKTHLNIIYTGSLYENINANVFFQGLQLLSIEERSKLSISFIGNFPEAELASYKSLCPNIKLSANWLSYMDCIEEIKKSDIGLLIDPPSQREGVFPIKLSDYIGTQTPIFSISGPKTYSSKIIDDGLAGYIADYNDSSDIARNIRVLLEDWQNGTLRRPTLAYSEQFSRKNRVLEFQKALDLLVYP